MLINVSMISAHSGFLGGKMRSFHITGMGCEACVKRVEKAVGSIDGVRKAVVDLASETLSVDYDDGKVSLEALRNAVEEAGYGLKEM